MWSSSAVVLLALVALACSNPTKMPEYDTIIIGMGAAGCTAAGTLSAAGKKVLALEAQNRVGGRVNTQRFGDGVVELGAEWIHGSHHSRVYDLAQKHNITLLSQGLNFKIYRSDGSRGDEGLVNELINFAMELTDDPPEKPEPLGQYITRRVKDYIKEKHPTLLQDEDFITEFLHFMDMVINNYESSNSWNDVTTESKYDTLEGDQHLSWHTHGYSTLFQILLNTYNNGPGYPNLDIKLNKEVNLISWSTDPSRHVTVSCTDGTTYTAENVIVTVSLGVLKERHGSLFSPPLPPQKIQAIHTTSIGVVGKIILSFSQPWWDTTQGGFPFIWRGEDRKALPAGDRWLANIDSISLVMGAKNVITLWTVGNDVQKVETLPEEEVKTKVMALIRRFMGKEFNVTEPTGMLRSTWHSNPYTRGSYTYDNLSSPLHPTARADLAAPLCDDSGKPRVLFAGEATDNTHFSTVHGATDTGHREAMRLLPQAKL